MRSLKIFNLILTYYNYSVEGLPAAINNVGQTLRFAITFAKFLLSHLSLALFKMMDIMRDYGDYIIFIFLAAEGGLQNLVHS